MIDNKSFAELLVYYRSKADLSQEELANKSGVSKIQIARNETGKGASPRLRTVMKLANALGVKTEDLGYRVVPKIADNLDLLRILSTFKLLAEIAEINAINYKKQGNHTLMEKETQKALLCNEIINTLIKYMSLTTDKL